MTRSSIPAAPIGEHGFSTLATVAQLSGRDGREVLSREIEDAMFLPLMTANTRLNQLRRAGFLTRSYTFEGKRRATWSPTELGWKVVDAVESGGLRLRTRREVSAANLRRGRTNQDMAPERISERVDRATRLLEGANRVAGFSPGELVRVKAGAERRPIPQSTPMEDRP